MAHHADDYAILSHSRTNRHGGAAGYIDQGAVEAIMRILLADDHVSLANTISLWLSQKAGFELVGIVTASQEIEEVIHKAKPCVLLLDWDLPGLFTDAERRQLIQMLHAHFPRLVIIVLRSDLRALPQALAGLVHGYISKTESPDYLLDLLVDLDVSCTHESY
ncbi:MAG: response regulator [Caldilineaceae bacterium]